MKRAKQRVGHWKSERRSRPHGAMHEWKAMRVQRERGHSDAVCPSGDDIFVSAPNPENYGVICISGSFL